MSMENIQQQVDQFIVEVKGEEIPREPGVWPNEAVESLCLKLIKEESKELIDAIEEANWPEIIDGAADTIFVILYAMSKAGIRLDPYWEEVCLTNLAKAGGPKDPVTGKQLKPPGWKPPAIKEMLERERLGYQLALDMKNS